MASRSPSSRVTATYAWQQLRKRALAHYGDDCHLCGRPGANTIDHLDPVARGGQAVPTIHEVRPAHRACNTRRGTRPVADFRRPGRSGILARERPPNRPPNGPTGVAVGLLASKPSPRAPGGEGSGT